MFCKHDLKVVGVNKSFPHTIFLINCTKCGKIYTYYRDMKLLYRIKRFYFSDWHISETAENFIEEVMRKG